MSDTVEQVTVPARYASLDAWRGAACLAVVVYHSWLYYNARTDHVDDYATSVLRVARYGALGVPIFFVISGYCIAGAAEASRRRSQSLGSYFIRRFRRIFPPYWIVLVASALIIAFVDVAVAPGFLTSQPRMEFRPWWLSPSQWAGNLTLTETWRPYLFGSPRAHYVGQSWTLCYEEQFYAVIGVVICVFANRFYAGVIVVTIASSIAQWAAWKSDVSIQGCFFDGAWLMFAAGVLVYHFCNYARPVARRLIIAFIAAAAAGLAVSGSPLGLGMTVAFGFALLLMLLHSCDRQIATSRWVRPLAFCGVMCYSLYLVHQFVVTALSKGLYASGIDSGVGTLLVTIPLCLAASIVIGWMFHVFVERRFLNSPSVNSASRPQETQPFAGRVRIDYPHASRCRADAPLLNGANSE